MTLKIIHAVLPRLIVKKTQKNSLPAVSDSESDNTHDTKTINVYSNIIIFTGCRWHNIFSCMRVPVELIFLCNVSCHQALCADAWLETPGPLSVITK